MPRARLDSWIEIEYDVIGEGPPLLLIGGLGSQLISWDDRFCELIALRGYTVIRYDNRDSGLSTILDERGIPDLLGLLVGIGSAPYLLDDMARDAVGLLDHLAIDHAHVLGLSLGGMIGQLIALTHPERIISLVAALSGPAGRPSDVPAPELIDALLQPPGKDFEQRVTRAVELRRALAGGGENFDAQEAARRARAQISRAYHPAGTMRQAAAVLGTHNHFAELARIRVPTMFVHGEMDPLVPFASAREAAGVVPDAEFVGIAGLGHDLPPDVAFELIQRVHEFHASHVPVD